MSDSLERPNFWGVLPANVRYSKVSNGAKIFYAEITSLCNKAGVCWATNRYFAELYGVSADSVSRWVQELVAEGFIESKVSAKEGNRRYLKVGVSAKIPGSLGKNAERYTEKDQDLSAKMSNQEQISDPKPNNISNNITKKQEAENLLLELISLVNPKEKPTDGRRRQLNGRLKDYTPDEIRAAAVAFSKSEWHKENKQMSIDNLLRDSKFGRWYEQGVADKPKHNDGTVGARKTARELEQEALDARMAEERENGAE